MMKRLTWFTLGAAAGVAGASVARKKLKAAAAELAPSNLAHKAADRMRAVALEGQQAIKAKAIELRQRLIAKPAEPGQVIELHRRQA